MTRISRFVLALLLVATAPVAAPFVAPFAAQAAPPPGSATQAAADQAPPELARARGTEFSALVVDGATGRVLVAHRATKAMVPASNMKVLTTAAALARLGPDFAFDTRVTGAAPQGGVVKGDLWVLGDGDPTICRRFDPEPLLADWADALWAAGVRRIEGGVVADDRAFESTRLHPDWTATDQERWYGAEISALILNEGCVDVTVAGGEARPLVTLAPQTGYVTVDLAASLTTNRKQHVYSVLRAGSDKRTLSVTGHVWRGAGALETSVPVRDPALYFATVLRERLTARGIAVGQPARRPGASEAAPTNVLFRRRGPLLRALEVTNHRSQNLYAECLLKTLGRRVGHGGSWVEGSKVVAEHAIECGASPGEVSVTDGSGLSRQGRLSAAALVAVLRATLRGPRAAEFEATLAEPSEEGTLERRLRNLPAGVRVLAKTGTLRGVSALSGYLIKGEKVLVFSVIGNGGSGARDAIDALVRRLANGM